MIAFNHEDRRLAEDALGGAAALLRRWPDTAPGAQWLVDVERARPSRRPSDTLVADLLRQARDVLDTVLAAPLPDDLPTVRPEWMYRAGTDLPDQAQRAREWVAELQRVRRWITVLLPEEHP